ncbi:MAG: hypothetical protein HYX67_12700, partial [Candidatus Melainabacteria bacterium]|nr:hypothetical protein [Candidatus Melainabacteria bacterium]
MNNVIVLSEHVREILGDGFTCEGTRRPSGLEVLSLEGELDGERVSISAYQDERWSGMYGKILDTWTL